MYYIPPMFKKKHIPNKGQHSLGHPNGLKGTKTGYCENQIKPSPPLTSISQLSMKSTRLPR